MHPRAPLFATTALLSTLLGSLAAQSPDHHLATTGKPLTTATAVDLDTIATDTADPTRLWAAGPQWKASFAADGCEFVPCFGAAAPRNFPTYLSRATIRVGEQVLPTDPVLPVLADGVVTFAGRSFTERYVLQQDGIEQQFVLPTLPQRGPIIVDVPVATELAVAWTDAGFRFSGEYGSFGYGRAVAIDAAGNRCDLTTERTASGFRIVVPQAFAADATLPLLIDPLVGAVTPVFADTRLNVSTDMAWHEGMGHYCLTWERVFSATDSDVYAQHLDGNLLPTGARLTIDVTTTSWRKPRIASASADTFLIVAQASTANVLPFSGKGRLVTGSPATVQPVLSLFSPGYDIFALDVGGDANISNGRFCIVAETAFGGGSHDIAAETRSDQGTLQTSAYLDNSPGFEMAPQISKSNGNPGFGSQAWGVAYLRSVSPSQNQPLFTSITWNLTTLAQAVPTPFLTPATDNKVAISSPTDHTQGRQYMLFATYDSGSYEFGKGAIVDRQGTMQATTGASSFSDVAGEPQIDCDGTRYVLAMQQTWSPTQNEAKFVLFANTGGSLDSQQWSGGSTTNDVAPCVVARRSGGGSDRSYGVAWVENLTATSSRVVASAYDGIQEGPQFAHRFTGCGGLGFLSGGSTVLGDSIDVQLASNVGLLGWVVGLPVDAPLAICPGCRQGSNGSVVLGASYTFAVPRNPAFVGMTLAFQGFQFLPAPGNGACLSQVNLSNTLDATIR